MKIKLLKYFKKKPNSAYGRKFNTYKKAQNSSNTIGEYFDYRFTKFEGPNKIELIDRFYVGALLPALINKKKPVIIDIGGGPNPVYSYIVKATNIQTKCLVLDTEKLVKIIKNKLPKKFRSNVKYISSLNEIKFKSVDIVYFNSSMQYLENYEQTIRRLIKLNPKFILISYTTFNKRKKNYFSIQFEVPGSVHPVIFFSPKKLIMFMNKMRYKEIFKNKYKLYQPNKDYYYGDILFKKK
jgi:putative methyltransferase (TIGR04325 family)